MTRSRSGRFGSVSLLTQRRQLMLSVYVVVIDTLVSISWTRTDA